MLPFTASPDLAVLQCLGRYVYQFMCVSITCIQICPHPPLDQFCYWSVFVPKHKQLHGQAVCGPVGRRDGEKEKLRLNRDLLSGLLMYILMLSGMVSLGVQESLACCRGLGAFIPPILENILFATPACFHGCAAFSGTEVLDTLKILAI